MGEISDAQFHYLEHIVHFVRSIKNVLKQLNSTPEDFCARFSLPLEEYNNFITGNFNYNIEQLTVLNMIWSEIETAKLKGREPFQVATEKDLSSYEEKKSEEIDHTWISIDNLLPDKSGEYKVKSKNGHEEIVWYDAEKEKFHFGTDSVNHLIAYWKLP